MNENARDVAFCCFGLLRLRNRLDRITEILPEARRQRIREGIQQLSRRSPQELVSTLEQTREASAATQAARAAAHWLPGGSAPLLGALSPSLQRWLCMRLQESDGREDH